MPRKYAIAYREVTEPITEPVTKFGGQPVWVAEPRWPLSRMYGTPMQFICQIALDSVLFGDLPARMAYLFLTDWDYESVYPETFDPERGENALILQPGGSWSGPFLPLEKGAGLYRRFHRNGCWEQVPCEFAIDSRPGDDPEPGTWDNVDPDDTPVWDAYFEALLEDKIGGAPVPTMNRPGFPDLEQWRLLLQHNAKDNADNDDPFSLNMAYDAVGYAFLSVDGRSGKFLWSR